jgi:hypothetical protein
MKGRLSCLILLIVSLAVHTQNDTALIHIRLIDGQTGLLRTNGTFHGRPSASHLPLPGSSRKLRLQPISPKRLAGRSTPVQ